MGVIWVERREKVEMIELKYLVLIIIFFKNIEIGMIKSI